MTNQLLEYTIVHFHLRFPAFVHMVVVVLETFPVSIELFQAVGIDILDPVPQVNIKSRRDLFCPYVNM